MPTSGPAVRPYAPADDRGWLICRLLSFFDTCYYDDVHPTRTLFERPSIQLVAELDGQVVGILASLLLSTALRQLPGDVGTIDAWTREDASALAWYRSQGFAPRHQYLHAYKSGEEPTEGFAVPSPLSGPVTAFCHAPLSAERELRARLARVYVCTQFLRRLAG